VAAALLGFGLALPLLLSEYAIGLVALWLPLVILAISIDLLWGENRIVSFGQGAFFAGGGYIAGLLLKGPAADTTGTNYELLGVGGGGSNSTFDNLIEALSAPQVAGVPFLAFPLAVLACGLVGLLVGAAVFRLGSVEVYAPLVTLGVGVVAGTVFLDTHAIGASNGLSGIPSFTSELFGGGQRANYLFNLGWVALVYLGYWGFRSSRWGRLWRAAGDDPIRLEALGVPVRRVRSIGFALACGLAGALYAGYSGFISAELAGVIFSVQALIWVAVGGPGFLLGPLLGVMAIKVGENYLSESLQESWQLLLGLLLIAVVLAAPRGLAGIPTAIHTRTLMRVARR
jgi:ABC-type branched-subunit amino acid transport system permease subunit